MEMGLKTHGIPRLEIEWITGPSHKTMIERKSWISRVQFDLNDFFLGWSFWLGGGGGRA